jgi:hypothetical protein
MKSNVININEVLLDKVFKNYCDRISGDLVPLKKGQSKVFSYEYFLAQKARHDVIRLLAKLEKELTI